MSLSDKIWFRGIIVTKNFDGDTITADIDMGKGIWLQNENIRLHGIDTAEMRGGTSNTKLIAKIAQQFVSEHTIHQTPVEFGYNAYIQSFGITSKYGEWLGRLYSINDLNINKELVELGLAKPYMGKTKNKWTDDECVKLLELDAIKILGEKYNIL